MKEPTCLAAPPKGVLFRGFGWRHGRFVPRTCRRGFRLFKDCKAIEFPDEALSSPIDSFSTYIFPYSEPLGGFRFVSLRVVAFQICFVCLLILRKNKSSSSSAKNGGVICLSFVALADHCLAANFESAPKIILSKNCTRPTTQRISYHHRYVEY